MLDFLDEIFSLLPFNGDKTKIGGWGSFILIGSQLMCTAGVIEACAIQPSINAIATMLGITILGLGHKKIKKIKDAL